MGLITIAIFLITAWGLGFSILFKAKQSDNLIERTVMQIGIGIGVLPVLGYLMNKFLFLPLNIWLVMILSLALPIYAGFRGKFKFKLPKFKLKKSHLYTLVVFVMFFITLWYMVGGAFMLNWYEDGDPWDHTTVAFYIGEKQTISKPADMYIAHYMEPYPQGYPIVMGLLYQVEKDVFWTLKYINSFIVSLSILFGFYFVKKLTKKSYLALIAAFILFASPTFQSHFIFAQSLALMLFFPALYAIIGSRDDKNWIAAAAVVTGAVLITQQLSGLIMGVFFVVYYLVNVAYTKNLQYKMMIAGILAIVIAALFYVPMFIKYDTSGVEHQYTLGVDPLHKSFFNFADSSSVRYLTASDFIHACITDNNNVFQSCPRGHPNKTDNPTGFGPMLFIITLLGLTVVIAYLIFSFGGEKGLKRYSTGNISENRIYMTTVAIWFTITLLMVLADRFPIKILPNRCWAFLTIAVCIFGAEGYTFIERFLKKVSIPKLITLLVIIPLILLTSFIPKMQVNTSPWAPHRVPAYMDQKTGAMTTPFSQLMTLPKGTPVFPFCIKDYAVIGYNAKSYVWDPEIYNYRYQLDKKPPNWDSVIFQNVSDISKSKMFSATPSEFAKWLKMKDYKITIVDSDCVKHFGENVTQNRVTELINSRLFIYRQDLAPLVALEVV